MAYFIQKAALGGTISFLTLLFIAFFAYCILNFFVDFHANFAEGIQISYLLETELGSSKQFQDSHGFRP